MGLRGPIDNISDADFDAMVEEFERELRMSNKTSAADRKTKVKSKKIATKKTETNESGNANSEQLKKTKKTLKKKKKKKTTGKKGVKRKMVENDDDDGDGLYVPTVEDVHDALQGWKEKHPSLLSQDDLRPYSSEDLQNLAEYDPYFGYVITPESMLKTGAIDKDQYDHLMEVKKEVSEKFEKMKQRAAEVKAEKLKRREERRLLREQRKKEKRTPMRLSEYIRSQKPRPEDIYQVAKRLMGEKPEEKQKQQKQKTAPNIPEPSEFAKMTSLAKKKVKGGIPMQEIAKDEEIAIRNLLGGTTLDDIMVESKFQVAKFSSTQTETEPTPIDPQPSSILGSRKRAKKREKKSALSESQIELIKTLHRQNPNINSVSKLARQLGMSKKQVRALLEGSTQTINDKK